MLNICFPNVLPTLSIPLLKSTIDERAVRQRAYPRAFEPKPPKENRLSASERNSASRSRVGRCLPSIEPLETDSRLAQRKQGRLLGRLEKRTPGGSNIANHVVSSWYYGWLVLISSMFFLFLLLINRLSRFFEATSQTALLFPNLAQRSSVPSFSKPPEAKALPKLKERDIMS